MKKIILFTVATVMALTAYAKDIKTVTFTVDPPMHCEKCEARIKNQLKFEKGIKKIDASAEKQTVTVVYDADKTSTAKLSVSLKKIGYAAKIKK
ncbi:MAG: heavy-metal-associated domain-containing protein [Barnesiella sp.]|nr:heavy-metal-associated domain-containing protein [Bacteroidales bacterium]MBD5245505.1 heavy-metal-associated domain-containing protein [Barnesiella sp.]MBD5248487.1 heavy-metal-associated domain-containing protein [Barnesiella sp.]